MLEFRPVTRERLPDLARFSERHGTVRYCSRMRWRLTSAAYRLSGRERWWSALDDLVGGGTPVAVLAYRDGEPVGWRSVVPRLRGEPPS